MAAGFKLNGVHCSTHNIVCTTGRSVMPDQESREVKVPGRPGTYDFGFPVFGKRKFKMACVASGSSLEDIKARSHAIAAWAAAATTLEFDDEPGVLWTGRVLNGIDTSVDAMLFKFVIEFEAQPYAEAQTASLATAGGVFNNSGNAEAWGKLVATISAGWASSTIKVVLSSSGKYVQLDGFAATVGDVISVDMALGRALKNDVSMMGNVNISSIFWPVPVGSQSFLTEPTAGVTCSLTFKRRWV